MSCFIAEDEATGGLEDWGNCPIFNTEEDREAAMKDYEFQKSLKEGMGPVDDEE